MKRKVISFLFVMAMGISLLVGCGDSKDNNTESGSNQNDNSVENNEDDAGEHLKTYEFSSVMGEKIGVLTYNGDTIKFDEEVFDNIAHFDMCIKNEDGSYTTGVTFQTINCIDAETYYQEVKSDTELNEKVVNSQFSDVKEAVINGVNVKYFNRIYSMESGSENKDFYCFVDFPTIDNTEYAVVLSMHYGREDEVLLSGLENLLVDIEIQGVKPGATVEDTSIKNDEFYDPWYDETCLITPSGKKVNIYFVGEGSLSWEAEPDIPSSVYIYDKNQDMCFFSVGDAASAEEDANNILQWNDYLEIGTQEEIQLAGRTIHIYHFVDKETGDVFLSEGVIELASDVVFTFSYNHMNYDESGLEEVLEELRFVVEQ